MLFMPIGTRPGTRQFVDFDKAVSRFLSPHREASTTRSAAVRKPVFTPKVDIYEFDTKFSLEVELPGIAKDNVEIDVAKDKLTIAGKINSDDSANKAMSAQKERQHGQFKRSFTLSENIDSSAIEATMKNGVLLVDIPKKLTEDAGVKRIPIG